MIVLHLFRRFYFPSHFQVPKEDHKFQHEAQMEQEISSFIMHVKVYQEIRLPNIKHLKMYYNYKNLVPSSQTEQDLPLIAN